MRSKPSRKGDRGINFTCGVFIFLFFVSLCERTLNVRGFPVREEGQVAWLESPNGLGASSTASSYRMQSRGFLLQQIYDREQIETVEHSPAGGEEVRQQLRLPAQEATKLSQDARFASAHGLLRNL